MPAAKEASREERRFNRYDRDRNESVSRIEMMSTRTAAFRKLDKDRNNLLSFEEWAAATQRWFLGRSSHSRSLTEYLFAWLYCFHYLVQQPRVN